MHDQSLAVIWSPSRRIGLTARFGEDVCFTFRVRELERRAGLRRPKQRNGSSEAGTNYDNIVGNNVNNTVSRGFKQSSEILFDGDINGLGSVQNYRPGARASL